MDHQRAAHVGLKERGDRVRQVIVQLRRDSNDRRSGRREVIDIEDEIRVT